VVAYIPERRMVFTRTLKNKVLTQLELERYREDLLGRIETADLRHMETGDSSGGGGGGSGHEYADDQEETQYERPRLFQLESGGDGDDAGEPDYDPDTSPHEAILKMTDRAVGLGEYSDNEEAHAIEMTRRRWSDRCCSGGGSGCCDCLSTDRFHDALAHTEEMIRKSTSIYTTLHVIPSLCALAQLSVFGFALYYGSWTVSMGIPWLLYTLNALAVVLLAAVWQTRVLLLLSCFELVWVILTNTGLLSFAFLPEYRITAFVSTFLGVAGVILSRLILYICVACVIHRRNSQPQYSFGGGGGRRVR
jgi:hypothetical protein